MNISANFSDRARFAFAMVLFAFLTACGGGGGSSDAPAAVGGEPAQLQTVEPQSRNVLLVTFDSPPDEQALDPDNYQVVTPDGRVLEVVSITPTEDPNVVLVGVEEQPGEGDTATSQASLKVAGSGTEQVAANNEAGPGYALIYNAPGLEPVSMPFEAIFTPEPELLSVVAVDLGRLELTFSEPMSESAIDVTNYGLVFAGDDAMRAMVNIQNARFGDTQAVVVLSIEPLMPDAVYMLTSDLVQSVSNIFTNPNRNQLDFTTNFAAPRLVSATVVSETEVRLAFSKPLDDSAAQIDNFLVSPELVVQGAELLAGGVDILLQVDNLLAVDYQITATGVSDRRAVELAPDGRTAQFSGGRFAAENRPRVVSAASGGNNTVFVVFSRPMNGNALDPSNYSIVQENVNPEVGSLGVTSVEFTDGERLAVELLTRSQNELTYRVKVSNVTDLTGLPLADQERGVDPTSTTFAGIPPSQNEIVDSDGDGISDSAEQRGYVVSVQNPDGSISQTQVTSDPDDPDTDGDGITDDLERQFGTNARSGDTDGDTLSDNLELNTIFSNPYAVDSDGDGLEDGLEHNDLHTSPLLADSDGDQLTDDQELFELNRDPLVADIPEVQINVGEVRLQIDERYTYTDETGQTVSQESNSSSTLSRSQDTSFSTSDSSSTEISGGFTLSFAVGGAAAFGAVGSSVTSAAATPTGKTENSGTFERTTSDSFTATQSSSQASQQSYENSLSKGRTFTQNSAVTREVVGARIDVDLSVSNTGSIPFTLSDLEITVLQPSPIDTSRLVPVATLVSNSELLTGTPLQINLGPFNSSAGPFLFANAEVFPNLIEELMSNPRGLIFRVANYNLSDELGRNFVFANQVARDRTASLIFDYGDADAAENFLVATSGALDDEGFGGAAGEYVGGFDGEGRTIGLPLNYVLQKRLGLTRHDRSLDYIAPGPNGLLDTSTEEDVLAGDDASGMLDDGTPVIEAGPNGRLETRPTGDDLISNPDLPDGIVAGPLRVADSIAQGDDIQEVPPGTTGLSIGTIVVSAGDNGVLDTPAQGDDSREFVTGYETRNTCSIESDKAADTCYFDADCDCAPGDDDPRCADDQEPLGAGGMCTGPVQLHRVNALRNGDFNRSWVLISNGDGPPATDFDEIIVRPAQTLGLAFLQDLDNDGLFARNEYLANSIDSPRDRLSNADFGVNFDFDTANLTPDGIPDSRDTDGDGIGDFAEVRVGWMVSVDGGPLRRVYPLPFLADSDGDGLTDFEEQDVSGYCDTTHADYSLCLNFPPSPAIIQADAVAILAGSDSIADSVAGDADGDGEADVNDMGGRLNDDVQVALGDGAQGARAVIVTAGADGIMQTALGGDDIYISANYAPPALDPVQRDTDLDEVTDGEEMNGLSFGLAIIDGGAGQSDTLAAGTDIQQVAPGNPSFAGGIVVLPGPDGTLETSPFATDDIFVGTSILCGPNVRADTQARPGTDDVQLVAVGEVCLGPAPAFIPSPAIAVIGAGPDGVLQTRPADDAVRATMTAFTNPIRPDTDDDALTDGREVFIGSNPTAFDGDEFRDDDRDGLSNAAESELGWIVSVAGLPPITVRSNPSTTDTDNDGLPDLIEREIRTNPNLADTDRDGLSDFDEVADFENFVRLAAPYPALNIQGGASARYGTSPTSADTDGDGLSDFKELIECSQITLPGASSPARICTSPLQADTDLDGASDREEIQRQAGATDPTSNDTDGDGRSDGVEIASTASDPLVPDIAFRLITRQVIADDDCVDGNNNTGELVWWFVLYPPGGASPVLLSDALDAVRIEPPEFGVPRLGTQLVFGAGIGSEGWRDRRDGETVGGEGTPIIEAVPADSSEALSIAESGAVEGNEFLVIPQGYANEPPRACYERTILSRDNFFALDKSSADYAMRRGQNFRIQAMVAERSGNVSTDCGLPPRFIPGSITAETGTVFDRTYFFDDLSTGAGLSITAQEGAAIPLGTENSSCRVDFKIDVEIIGGSLGGTP